MIDPDPMAPQKAQQFSLFKHHHEFAKLLEGMAAATDSRTSPEAGTRPIPETYDESRVQVYYLQASAAVQKPARSLRLNLLNRPSTT